MRANLDYKPSAVEPKPLRKNRTRENVAVEVCAANIAVKPQNR